MGEGKHEICSIPFFGLLVQMQLEQELSNSNPISFVKSAIFSECFLMAAGKCDKMFEIFKGDSGF